MAKTAALHIGDEALRRMPNVFGSLDPIPLKASGADANTERPVAGMRLREVEIAAIVEHSPVQTRAPFDPEHDEDDAALLRSLETEGQTLAVEQATLLKTETCARRVLALLDAQLDLAELARRGKFIATLAPALTVLADRMKALQAARDQGVTKTMSEHPNTS